MSDQHHTVDHRPWGYYEVLCDEQKFKVKKIVVHAGKRLSLQRHQGRSEHWHIIEGKALVTVDNNIITLHSGASIDIPQRAVHRIENTGDQDLTFIEIQRGDYFDEHDIERLEDDFGRI